MKSFVTANWYRLMTAASMLIFACAFFIFSLQLNTAKAGIPDTKPYDPGEWIVGAGKYIYLVTYDQFSKKYKCEIICDN